MHSKKQNENTGRDQEEAKEACGFSLNEKTEA